MAEIFEKIEIGNWMEMELRKDIFDSVGNIGLPP